MYKKKEEGVKGQEKEQGEEVQEEPQVACLLLKKLFQLLCPSSDSCASLLRRPREEHKFRRLALEHPGVFFASTTHDMRTALGQIGTDLDIGTHGPLFRKL